MIDDDWWSSVRARLIGTWVSVPDGRDRLGAPPEPRSYRRKSLVVDDGHQEAGDDGHHALDTEAITMMAPRGVVAPATARSSRLSSLALAAISCVSSACGLHSAVPGRRPLDDPRMSLAGRSAAARGLTGDQYSSYRIEAQAAVPAASPISAGATRPEREAQQCGLWRPWLIHNESTGRPCRCDPSIVADVTGCPARDRPACLDDGGPVDEPEADRAARRGRARRDWAAATRDRRARPER